MKKIALILLFLEILNVNFTVNAYQYGGANYLNDLSLPEQSNYIIYENADTGEVELAIIYSDNIESRIAFYEQTEHIVNPDVYLYPFDNNDYGSNDLEFERQRLYLNNSGDYTNILKKHLSNDNNWHELDFIAGSNLICENVAKVIETNIPLYEVIAKPAKIYPEKVIYERSFNGKYFSKFFKKNNKSYIMFSENGIDYDVEVELPEDDFNGIGDTVYGNGVYIAIGSPEFMPLPSTNITWVNYSKIMYVLNEKFEIIHKSIVQAYRVCCGLYNGYFYFKDQTSNSTNYYKSLDGIELLEISKDEYVQAENNININKNKAQSGYSVGADNAGYYLEYMDNKFYIDYESDFINLVEGVGASKYWSGILNTTDNKYLTFDGVYSFAKLPEDENNISPVKWTSSNYVYWDNDMSKFYRMPIDPYQLSNTYVRLNDTILGFSQPPVMESDRILVPMRFLFEQMGAEVDWNDATQTATAKISARGESGERSGAGENTVTFSIDNTTAYVNGAETPMDVPARLINDQTFVPLRFLSENLGYNVEWDEETNTAVITTE